MNSNYIVIQGWMISELHLKGLSLLIYATIFGVTQDGTSEYLGSSEYIANFFCVSPKQVKKVIFEMVEKGLLVRNRENRITAFSYSAIRPFDTAEGSNKSSLQGSNLFSKGSNKSSLQGSNLFSKTPINNIYNIYNNIADNKEQEVQNLEKKEEKGCAQKEENSPKRNTLFSKPTIDDVKQYCSARHNSIDAESFLDFYQSNGWKVGKNPMRDWKAAIRTWERRESKGKKSIDLNVNDYWK